MRQTRGSERGAERSRSLRVENLLHYRRTKRARAIAQGGLIFLVFLLMSLGIMLAPDVTQLTAEVLDMLRF